MANDIGTLTIHRGQRGILVREEQGDMGLMVQFWAFDTIEGAAEWLKENYRHAAEEDIHGE